MPLPEKSNQRADQLRDGRSKALFSIQVARSTLVQQETEAGFSPLFNFMELAERECVAADLFGDLSGSST